MAKNSEATLLLRIKSSGEDVLSKTGDALKKLGEVAVAAYAAANAAAVAALHAYGEQEEATNKLNQALINQGIYTKSLSASYQKIATDLSQVSAFGDEAIISAQAQIQQYVGQTKITKDLTKATLDFASAMGMDLDSAANTIGKSIGTNTNMLGRYGITLDENASKSDKLASVTQQLERRFGGQAEAATQGLGSLKLMKNSMGELLEVAGEKLAPIVTYAAREITKFAIQLQTNEEMIQNFQSAAILLGMAGITLKNVIVGLGEAIGQVFGTITGAVMQIASGDFKMAFESIKSGFSDTAKTVTSRYDTFGKELSAIDQIVLNQKKNEDEQELVRMQQTSEAKRNINNSLILTQEQMFAARDEKEIRKLLDQEVLKKDQHLRELNNKIAREENHSAKLELERQKRQYLDDKYDQMDRGRILSFDNFQKGNKSQAFQDMEGTLSNMAAMQQSKNGVLVGIGKAAAIAQITISTIQATVDAFRFGNTLGGPVAGGILAGPLAFWGAEQVASVAGVQLAEGGIVKATPGGVPAIIGEGGRDEMVIPLEKGQGPGGMGTRIHIQVNGGFLGTQSEAKEFAIALDKELLKLRQSNESLAFDRGII